MPRHKPGIVLWARRLLSKHFHKLFIVALLYALVHRWRAMHRRAMKYFHKRLSDNGRVAVIDARLRQLARDVVASLPDDAVHRFPKHLDVVLSGGGFRNAYSAGVGIALETLAATAGRGHTERWAGASAGAQVAFGCQSSSYSETLKWGFAVQETLHKFPWMQPFWMWDAFWPWLAKTRPLPAPGAMTVAVTRITWRGVQSVRVSEFANGADLGDALLCSGCIPVFLHSGVLPRVWRGMGFYDGGITDNTPVFHDGLRPQLVVRFLTIREGIIYYTVDEMVQLVEKGIRELGELVREGAETLRARPHNLNLLNKGEEYNAVHAVVPPSYCCAEPMELALRPSISGGGEQDAGFSDESSQERTCKINPTTCRFRLRR